MRRGAGLWITALVAGLVALGGCGGGDGDGADATMTADQGAAIVEPPPPKASTAGYAGGTVSPVNPAPELGLRTWDGRRVTMARYQGKAVLVTFVYVGCPDICPLIIDNLIHVKRRLGAAGKHLRIVAVSVDPVGDTPAAVRRFLAAHRATKHVDYLVGSRAALEATWARWGIGARADPKNPSLVEHSGVIWGVDSQGRRATFYPASGFDVEDIEADVRLLLAQ